MRVFSRGEGYLVRLWLVQAIDILEMPDREDQVLTRWKSPRFYRGQLDEQLVNRDAQ
jgi:isochorismate hydrolase